MAASRQEAFQKLRPPCVELSSVGLKFRANLVTAQDITRALEPVHSVLLELSRKDGLDEKLAEYAFFPLTHIFNRTQQASVRCLELAVRCLQILIEKGWRQKLSAQMGKQLLILLTVLAGGAPGQNQNAQISRPQSEELSLAAFDCIGTLCHLIQGEEARATIFDEVGSATVVDQAVYILLEAVVDGPADQVQLSAASALQAIHSRITDRVVLASLMPRTVSALTKTLSSSSQTRRSYKLLCCCLDILTDDLRRILNDVAVSSADDARDQSGRSNSSDRIALDQSWLNATVSQVKKALANVIPLRNHDKWEVRRSLLHLCLVVIEECENSLENCLSMAIETVVVLSNFDDSPSSKEAYTAIKHLVGSSGSVADILKSSLHSWIVALPRVMQSTDDSAKQRAIRQIATGFQILSEALPKNNILDESMTTTLCDSVSAAIRSAPNAPQLLEPPASGGLEVGILDDNAEPPAFAPVLMEHRSQKDTLVELKSMIAKLNRTDVNLDITRSLLNRIHRESGDTLIPPFWLALSFLKSSTPDTLSFDDILDVDSSSSGLATKAGLIEELYSISLPILTETPSSNREDWRLSALALEAVALQAQQLKESFRPELIDTLYPVLQFMDSSNPALHNHAMTCLGLLTRACGYPNASTMLVDNVDYLINSVALKLNTFDISPQAPQVLLMMVRLCGARLIPYLDDLIGSIFAVLDSFHGYPKLVELLFDVLGTIVDESAKKPVLLAIADNEMSKSEEHRKGPHRFTNIYDLAKEFKNRRDKSARAPVVEDVPSKKEMPSHPKQPWSSTPEEPEEEGDIETDSQDEQSPPAEEEKSLSKSHNLLLNIIKSIPPHLSSPSPFLRRSLLSIFTRGLPILAHDQDSFLPVISDLWPSVSARITLPPERDAHTSSSLSTSLPSSDTAAPSIDETGIQEETFVIVASCTAIDTMCKGAGDFMSSRIEQDFSRWKKLYIRSWDRVRQDSEKAAERQQFRLQQQRQQDTYRSISQIEALNLNEQSSSSDLQKLPAQPHAPSTGYSPPPPPPPPSKSKSFTPHHALFKALASLFTTLISHVRLPADISDDIVWCLGSWVSFYYPEYYFSFSWRRQNLTNNTATAPLPSETPGVGAAPSDETDAAIQAMDAWNPDLTWFIFSRARANRWGGTIGSSLSGVKRRMDERIVKEVQGGRYRAGCSAEERTDVNDGFQGQPLRFAELVI